MDGGADQGGNVRPAPLPKIVASNASVAHQGQVAPKMLVGAQDAFAPAMAALKSKLRQIIAI